MFTASIHPDPLNISHIQGTFEALDQDKSGLIDSNELTQVDIQENDLNDQLQELKVYELILYVHRFVDRATYLGRTRLQYTVYDTGEIIFRDTNVWKSGDSAILLESYRLGKCALTSDTLS